MVYALEIIIIALITLLYHCTINGKNILTKESYLKTSLFVAFLVLALRGKFVGVDTSTYIRGFYSNRFLSFSDIFTLSAVEGEKGYNLFVWLIGKLTSSPQILLAGCAAIYFVGIYYLYKYNALDPVTVLFCFLSIGSYNMAFNAMRQSVALGLCLIAWVMLNRKKYKFVILFVVLAVLFHISALIFLVTFLVHFIPTEKRYLFVLMAISLLIVLRGRTFIDVLVSFFPTYSMRYGHGRWQNLVVNRMLIVWVIEIIIIIAMAFMMEWKKNELSRKMFDTISMSLISMSISFVAQSYDGLARMGMYYAPFLPLLFDNFLLLFDNKMKGYIRIPILVAMSMLFLVVMSTEQYQYVFFWKE